MSLEWRYVRQALSLRIEAHHNEGNTMTHIMSAGMGHEDFAVHTKGAHIILDVRKMFKDPHGISEEMKQSNGLDPKVIESVMSQPGATSYVLNIAYLIGDMLLEGHDPFIVFACVGGRHRSVALADKLAETLWTQFGYQAFVTHVHVDYPIIGR